MNFGLFQLETKKVMLVSNNVREDGMCFGCLKLTLKNVINLCIEPPATILLLSTTNRKKYRLQCYQNLLFNCPNHSQQKNTVINHNRQITSTLVHLNCNYHRKITVIAFCCQIRGRKIHQLLCLLGLRVKLLRSGSEICSRKEICSDRSGSRK